MTIIFDGVDVVVEVAWGVAPLTDPGSWTDVSAYVMRVDTRIGKSSERDTFDAGTAQIVVNNASGLFDPNNVAGPYFGNVVPWTHVRVRATYSSTTYPVWRGYIVGYTQEYDASSDAALTTLECVDLFGYLTRVPLTSTPLSRTVKLGFEPNVALLSSLLSFSGVGTIFTSTDVSSGTNAGGDLLWAGVQVASPESRFSEQYRRAGIVRGSSGSFEFGAQGESLSIFGGMLGRTVFGFVQITRWPTANAVRTSGSNVEPRARTIAYCQPGDLAVIMETDGSVNVWGFVGSVGTVRASLGIWNVGSIHMIGFTNTGGVTYVYVDGHVVHQLATLSLDDNLIWGNAISDYGGPSPQACSVGFILDSVCQESTPLSAAQVLENWNELVGGYAGASIADLVNIVLDRLGVPAGLRNVDSASLGSFQKDTFFPWGLDALNVLRSLESLELARMYVDREGRFCFRPHYSTWYDVRTTGVSATFGDGVGEVGYSGYQPVLDDSTIVNTVDFSTGAGDRTLSDSTSVARYGTYRTSVDLDELTDPNVSEAAATLLVERNKNPYSRAGTLTFFPRNNPAAKFATVLGLDVGKKYSLVRRPPNAGTQTTNHLADGVQHSIDVDSWTASAYLSRAESSDGFIVGDATFGVVGTSSVSF